MAIVKCKECGHEVSNKADVCPNCGAPLKKKKKGRGLGCGGLIVVVFLGAVVYTMFSDLTHKTSTSTPVSAGPVAQDDKIPVAKGDKITIVTLDTRARLCPQPDCGQDQQIARIPESTILVIEGIKKVKSGMMPPVERYEVTFKGKRGWVSIYNTDKQ